MEKVIFEIAEWVKFGTGAIIWIAIMLCYVVFFRKH